MPKQHFPQTQDQWLNTGKFSMEKTEVGEFELATALCLPKDEMQGVVIMSGGIPRDRNRKTPTINKQYGQAALNLAEKGFLSVLYNQPGTGDSSGDFESISFNDRIDTLSGLACPTISCCLSSRY